MKIQKTFKNDAPSFYIIPTPIGNLEDITLRSIKILSEIEVLYCEDTRVTVKLLNYLNLKIKLKTYNDYSFEKEKNNILENLNSGKKIGLVSDAGMPCISDPGYQLVSFLKENKINVVILPGPTAFVLPIVFGSFGTSKSTFYGFLNKSKSKALEELVEVCESKFNTIIYESPYRLLKTLENISKIDSSRKILIARELTKIFEEYIEGSVNEVLEHFSKNKPRGEFILVISGKDLEQEMNDDIDYVEEVGKLLINGNTSKDAIKEIAQKYKISKNWLYEKYLENKKTRS